MHCEFRYYTVKTIMKPLLQVDLFQFAKDLKGKMAV